MNKKTRRKSVVHSSTLKFNIRTGMNSMCFLSASLLLLYAKIFLKLPVDLCHKILGLRY